MRRRISRPAITALLLLLVFPSLALCRLASLLDLRWIFGYWICISAFTYFLYARDKKKAESDEWRIPETTLHIAELAGGWPGAFIAQRMIRHKIRKVSYQILFWVIVLAYQVVALDCVLYQRISQRLVSREARTK